MLAKHQSIGGGIFKCNLLPCAKSCMIFISIQSFDDSFIVHVK